MTKKYIGCFVNGGLNKTFETGIQMGELDKKRCKGGTGKINSGENKGDDTLKRK